MDTAQVINLAKWVADTLPHVSETFGQLHQKLEHNAMQPQKVPLRDQLQNLLAVLENMSFELLTNEEIDLLREMEVLSFLGQTGRTFVNDTVTVGNFDPASAAADILSAMQKIDEVNLKMVNFLATVQELGLEKFNDEQQMMDLSLVRVRFKEEASIDDVGELKRWAADWHDIARGAAVAVGTTPQSVKVVGANNGSVIITLGTIATVTMVLAIIAKNACRIASEVLSIANDIEDFRHKRRLNKVIEDELKSQQRKVEETGVEDTLTEIKDRVPYLGENEVENVLRKSIGKYLNFYKKGGDVDFIPPRSKPSEVDEGVEDQALLKQIAEQAHDNERLVGIIEEVRSQQAKILRLVHRADKG